jgi:nitroimidazol reductase NimA-like FMN-containing flavoprotein (pyridoxamine 5'-phosphate oxidase superfamily)
MLINEMSDRECRDLLSKVGFGRLACAREKQPYVVPIYFAYETDRLYGFATLGRKIEWMRANPLVCVEADEVRDGSEWMSVVVFGRYEEFPDTPEYSKVRLQTQSLLEKRSLWWQAGFAGAQTRRRPSSATPILFCIHIEEITGHRASPDCVEVSSDLVRLRRQRRGNEARPIWLAASAHKGSFPL